MKYVDNSWTKQFVCCLEANDCCSIQQQNSLGTLQQYMLSVCLHQEEMQCGINELKMRKSPGCRGTATPKVGKQK
jgi:hypothetical protein